MVLSLMRRHAKSWLIKFLIGMIAIVFVFYFGYSFRAGRVVKVAYVNGELITGLEYQKAYRELVDAYMRQYGEAWNNNLVKRLNLKARALEGLIERKLISYEAKRLGLSVTKEEIQQAIVEYPAFQVNGRFDMGRYRALLGRNHMKPEDFEDAMAQELLGTKVRQLLMCFSPVSEEEIRAHYAYLNEKVKISFVKFPAHKYEKEIMVTAEELKEFFEKHREEFRIPEKIKVSYIRLDPKEFEKEVKVSPQEVKEYYEYNLDRFIEEEKVKARHILFRLKDGASKEEEEAVRKKAESVLKKAKEGKDFAELAKKYSEGPTKDKGGDLGWFSRGRMVKPFEKAAFDLGKGEVSDLVRTRFGYHIIKVEDKRPRRNRPLEEVKEEITKSLAKARAAELAHERGLTLIDQMPYEVDLSKYAEENGLKAITTGPFSVNQSIPGIPASRKVREALFSLEKGETSDLVEIQGRFYIFQVVEERPSYLPELKEVEEEVKARLIKEKAVQRAKEVAEEFLAMLKEGDKWTELSKQYGLTPKSTDYFTRRGPIPMIGYEPDLQEAVFGLDEGNPYLDRVYVSSQATYVVKWEGFKAIDQEKYQKEKGTYRFSLMSLKQREFFKYWLETLKQEAKIEILTPVDEI